MFQVISLLETTTFTSPEFISETFLRTVARLLSGRTLVTWCLVIAAVAKTACAWAIVAQEENLQKESMFMYFMKNLLYLFLSLPLPLYPSVSFSFIYIVINSLFHT